MKMKYSSHYTEEIDLRIDLDTNTLNIKSAAE